MEDAQQLAIRDEQIIDELEDLGIQVEAETEEVVDPNQSSTLPSQQDIPSPSVMPDTPSTMTKIDPDMNMQYTAQEFREVKNRVRSLALSLNVSSSRIPSILGDMLFLMQMSPEQLQDIIDS